MVCRRRMGARGPYGGDPPPVAEFKAQIAKLTEDNTRLRSDNAERKALTTYYAHVINELSAELEQATAERDQLLGTVRAITAAPSRRSRGLGEEGP